MLPDTTLETVEKVLSKLFAQDGEYTPLYAAIEDVYDHSGGVSVSLTLSIVQVGNQQVDIKASAAVVINAEEKPVWKPERVVGENRIRINDRQTKLPGM